MNSLMFAVDMLIAIAFAASACFVWFGGFVPAPWIVGLLYAALCASCVNSAIHSVTKKEIR